MSTAIDVGLVATVVGAGAGVLAVGVGLWQGWLVVAERRRQRRAQHAPAAGGAAAPSPSLAFDQRGQQVTYQINAAGDVRFSPDQASAAAAAPGGSAAAPLSERMELTDGQERLGDEGLQAERRWDATTPTGDARPGPIFLSQVWKMANARVYAWVVIGTEFEGNTAFADDQIETYTSWLKALEPRAKVRQANSEFIWMKVPGKEGGSSLWAAEVRPGPVVSLLIALHITAIENNVGHAVGFDGLVGWWATIIGALPALVGDLGIDRVRLGFGLNPYGLDSTRVVQLNFVAAPQPTRRAEPHQIPPWNAYTPLFDPFNPPADILAAPIRDLLDEFSYGRVEPTQAWAAAGLADGSLKNRYPGPAGLVDGIDGSSCQRCGAGLKVRQLVDPPETPGEPSAALECTNQECRALHDDHGHLLRQHPEIVLRRQSES